jgi:glycosyltransferase involved in cell wall biosynthesis
VLLEAYRLLRTPPPLVLIGYPMRETDAILADPPPNVRVLGQWPPEAVHRAWKAALLGIVPSICQEACPTVIIEAMQAGLPVVATAMGGIPDLVVEGQTGRLVPPGDASALAAAIESLLADPAAVARLGQAGRRRSELFTASAIVPHIKTAYREAVATGSLGSA